MVSEEGFEPSHPYWALGPQPSASAVPPLRHNVKPVIYQAGKSVEATTGFEPVNKGFAGLCLTTWPRRHTKHLIKKARVSWLGVNSKRKDGADEGIRTLDIHLGKVVLYQLSYIRAQGYIVAKSSAVRKGSLTILSLDIASLEIENKSE